MSRYKENFKVSFISADSLNATPHTSVFKHDSDGQDLYNFGCSLGLCVVLQSLLASPSPIWHLIKHVLQQLQAIITNPSQYPSNSVLGACIGLAHSLHDLVDAAEDTQDAVRQLLQAVYSRLVSAVNSRLVGADSSVISGDVWVVSSAVCSSWLDDTNEIGQLLSKVFDLVQNNVRYWIRFKMKL
jgi:hypothetical protein